MSVELIVITAVSAFNLVCSIILLTMYKNAMTELDKLKKIKTEVEEISSVIELNDTAFEPMETEIKKKPRSAFKFSMIGLKPGDKLISTIDTKIIATVNDEINTIKMPDGNIYSLSKACEIIYFKKNPNAKRGSAFQGPAYWKYNGETLDDIRKRTENN